MAAPWGFTKSEQTERRKRVLRRKKNKDGLDLMRGTEGDFAMRQDAVINHKAIQTAYLFFMFVWVKAPEQAEGAQLYY